MKVKIKMADGSIEKGYELPVTGDFERWNRTYAIILLPPKERGGVACIVFARDSFNTKYAFKEATEYPFINLDCESRQFKNMIQLLKECRVYRKGNNAK